ncbi:RHS repeat-associated core domain-containing protein [Clostridium sp. AN503]|uniref:RHS repeat-associated core domain-containing protein n=1 Tax=Clostridium sp. AN503 TaxID=3160598 RepID=UPI0034589B9B
MSFSEYDAGGKKTNYTVAYTYNAEGNMTSLTSPKGRKKQYTYDVGGRMTERLTPSGGRIFYDYDTLNALADKSYSSANELGNDRPVKMVYNVMGQRISMEDITGESTYTYDFLGCLKTAINGSGKAVEYFYDEADNLSEILYPDGYTVLYEYDKNDNITKLTDRDGWATTYEYDPLNRLIHVIRADFYGYNVESYNPNTGLEFLRARYYNANPGRFFQEDTYLGDITDPLTLNRYAYVKNSPLNYVDPSGHRTYWDYIDRIELHAPTGEEIEKMQQEGTYERYIQEYNNLLEQQKGYDRFRADIDDGSGSVSSERLISLLREAKNLSEEYVGECDTGFYDLLVSVNWEKVGRITSGTIQVVGAGILIVAGISALVVAGGALGTAAAALLAGEVVSLAGVATAMSTFLMSLGSVIMQGADFLEGAENILNALQDNPERAEHLIRDKIELFRNHPAYYYIFEAILTFGSQLGKKLLTSGKVSVVKGESETPVFDTSKLIRSQQKAIESADNIISDHLKESDLSAALGDLQGNPIEKPNVGIGIMPKRLKMHILVW